MTPVTVVTGPHGRAREGAIAARLDGAAAVILEGLPDGKADAPLAGLAGIHRIAPGCLCCTGNLVLRVTLNRVLRTRPASLFIALADASHADRLCALLAAAPYDGLLVLQPIVHADA